MLGMKKIFRIVFFPASSNASRAKSTFAKLQFDRVDEIKPGSLEQMQELVVEETLGSVRNERNCSNSLCSALSHSMSAPELYYKMSIYMGFTHTELVARDVATVFSRLYAI